MMACHKVLTEISAWHEKINYSIHKTVKFKYCINAVKVIVNSNLAKSVIINLISNSNRDDIPWTISPANTKKVKVTR